MACSVEAARHWAHIVGASRTTPMQRSGTRASPRISRHCVVPHRAVKRCSSSCPFSTTTGSPSSVSSRPCLSPISTSGAVSAAALAARVADPPGKSRRQQDQPPRLGVRCVQHRLHHGWRAVPHAQEVADAALAQLRGRQGRKASTGTIGSPFPRARRQRGAQSSASAVGAAAGRGEVAAEGVARRR